MSVVKCVHDNCTSPGTRRSWQEFANGRQSLIVSWECDKHWARTLQRLRNPKYARRLNVQDIEEGTHNGITR